MYQAPFEILGDQAPHNLAVGVRMLRTVNTTNLEIAACWRTHQKRCKSLVTERSARARTIRD